MEKKMKLLVVSQYFRPETFRINDICDGLRERGWDIDVLTSLPNVPQGRFYDGYGWFRRGSRTDNGMNITRVGVVRRGTGNPVLWVLNCASFAFNALFHLPALRRGNYDAVFVFNNSPVTSVYPASKFAKKAKIPEIIYILDIWPDSMFFLLGKPEQGNDIIHRFMNRVCRKLYNTGDLILESSEGFEPRLRRLGVKSPVRYFPNYAEPPVNGVPVRTREQLGIPEEARVTGFAGNIGPAQGLDMLAKAAKDADSRMYYLIIGDGPSREELEKTVKEYGLEDRFIFTGWVNGADVPGYLALCDALLVSLKDSGVLNLTVPAKLQTYMLSGKPVIAFMNGAGAETVTAAGCGYTAPADNADALRNVLDTVSTEDIGILRQKGELGRAYCKNNFDRELLLDRLQDYIIQTTEEYNNK